LPFLQSGICTNYHRHRVHNVQWSLSPKIPSTVEGKITLAGETVNSLIKILVIKDDIQRWYEVKLVDGKFNEEIWLIDGTGKYQVSVLVHKKDRIYTFGPTVFVENAVEVNRFAVPTLHVESNNEKIIALAKELTKDAKTDREKAQKIYNWVVKNIKYDYDKYLRQLNKNYDNAYGALNTLEPEKAYATISLHSLLPWQGIRIAGKND